MKLRWDLVLNLAVAAALAIFGLSNGGPSFLLYVFGAAGLFLIVLSWAADRSPEMAPVVASGCAWAWLAVAGGILMQRWVPVVIGLLAGASWVMPLLSIKPKTAPANTKKKGRGRR